MKRLNAVAALAALLALGASLAHADDSHDNQVRVGVYYVHYASSADDLSGPYVPPGLNFKLEDIETLYVAYVRTLSKHFNLELAFGYPPLTKTDGKGPVKVGSLPYNNQVLSSARWLAPTLLLNYQFFDPSQPLRPYVGVGVNYTKFYDRQSTAAGNAIAGGPTSISLPSSVGPAATVGVAWRLSPRWSVYASYSGSEVNTRLRADTAGQIRTTHIDFWPLALVVSTGFSF